jgi:hypothetical protein
MKVVFADAYYYLALASKRDAGHERAIAISRDYRGDVLTTPWVLTEVADALAAPDQRHVFVAMLADLKSDAHTTLVAPTSRLFHAACELYSQRPDKGWSLTDCISFVVMEQHGITHALTADHHFEQAGFVALLRRGSPSVQGHPKSLYISSSPSVWYYDSHPQWQKSTIFSRPVPPPCWHTAGIAATLYEV